MSRTREQRKVLAGAQVIHYTLVRDVRRRHSHLFLGDDGAGELRAPASIDGAEADQLVVRNARWLAEASVRQARAHAAKPTLAGGAQLPFLDERLHLSLAPGHRWRVRRHSQQLQVQGPGIAGAQVDEAPLKAALEGWYRAQAAEIFWARLLAFGAPAGLTPSGITIRAQRSRWGSCSRTGHINLNWRLMLLPTLLADYVLIHELCHLRHMDHSSAFKALLASLLPDYREREQQLNAIRGSELAL